MNVEIVEEAPSPEEFNIIRQSVGWAVYKDIDALKRGLENSLYHICVRENGELIGMGRVIGDGYITFYIQDIIVVESRQGQGYGRRIMERITEWIGKHAVERAVIGLMSAKGKEPFYEKFGFIPRPDERFGKGMFQFFTAEEARQ